MRPGVATSSAHVTTVPHHAPRSRDQAHVPMLTGSDHFPPVLVCVPWPLPGVCATHVVPTRCEHEHGSMAKVHRLSPGDNVAHVTRAVVTKSTGIYVRFLSSRLFVQM